MTKIAIITDTHFGIRGDSEVFHDNSKRFLDEVFFKTIKDENIDTIFHLGDLVDRRKYINFNTAKRLRKDFLEPINKNKLNTFFILGNHDVYHKNTNETNAIEELVDGKYSHLKFFYEPTEFELFNTKFLMLPWICDENREQSLKMIDGTRSQLCMGHLELAGFPVFKGSTDSHGDDPTRFKRFDMVMSGHYHHRSQKDNIYYLGSHAEFTWSDYDDTKGFHIFDTKTRDLTFIKNPYTIFNKIVYDDYKDIKVDDKYTGKIIKVVVKNKTNPFLFDKFVDDLENVSPVEYQIIEDSYEIHDDDHVNEAESTLDIFKKYIEMSQFKDIDKKDLEKNIIELYNEALSI